MKQETNNKSKVLFDNLKKGDANKLRKWWDANTKYYHFVVKMDNSKYYKLIQQ